MQRAGQTPHGARPNREGPGFGVKASPGRTCRLGASQPPGRSLEPRSNAWPRGMTVLREQSSRQNSAYRSGCHKFLFSVTYRTPHPMVSAVKNIGSQPTSTAFRSPWQNGVAERWVGSCRRDLLDHVIILNEQHLKRLMSSFLLYYHQDRTHLGLAKDTPASRPTEIRSARERKIQSFPRLGGLHHRYAVAA